MCYSIASQEWAVIDRDGLIAHAYKNRALIIEGRIVQICELKSDELRVIWSFELGSSLNMVCNLHAINEQYCIVKVGDGDATRLISINLKECSADSTECTKKCDLLALCNGDTIVAYICDNSKVLDMNLKPCAYEGRVTRVERNILKK